MPAHAGRKRPASSTRRAKRTTTTKYAKRRKPNLPRYKIRTAVGSNPNVHAFKRAYSFPLTVGYADAGNHVYLNTDGTVQIVTLHTKFNKLPSYDDFKTLFSEYKITSIHHKLVPFYKDNVPFTASAAGANFSAIPNYEVFALPNSSSVRHEDLAALTGDQFNEYVNSSQRKSVRLMPSRTQTYWTKQPKVAGYKGPASVDAGKALMVMERPSYLSTDPTPIVTGGVDQTDVAHYGIIICFRRVDGQALRGDGGDQTSGQKMGFRMETDVYFNCRKVQSTLAITV